jgi:hypothetical protein
MMLNRLFLPMAASRLAVLAALAALAASPAIAAGPPAAQAPPVGTKQRLDDMPDSMNPIDYPSIEGQFRVTFPTGCSRLETKMNTAADGSANVDVRLVFVTCQRADTKEEGCQVSANLGVARGLKGRAATDLVLATAGKYLEKYTVVPERQTPVRRDFGAHGVVEGIDILAHPTSGQGDVWIRGMLRGDDIYFLVAWKAAGGMLDDPEYAVFFQSFQPWAE